MSSSQFRTGLHNLGMRDATLRRLVLEAHDEFPMWYCIRADGWKTNRRALGLFRLRIIGHARALGLECESVVRRKDWALWFRVGTTPTGAPRPDTRRPASHLGR